MKESNKEGNCVLEIKSIFKFLETVAQPERAWFFRRKRARASASANPSQGDLIACRQALKNTLCIQYITGIFILFIFFIAYLGSFSTLLAQPADEKFLKWVEGQIEKHKNSPDAAQRDIQLRPLEQAKTFFNGPRDLPLEKKITVEPIGDFIYTEIKERFEGDYKKAVQFYWAITTGKQKPSLFIESGAGRDEKITALHLAQDGVEFTTDRVYQSSLAFNSRTTVHLRRFDVDSKRLVVIVNEVVQDWGAELAKKKIKRHSKSYYPIFCDLNIDVYQETEPNQFWYHSYALYRGQGMKSTNLSLNVAKKVGDVFSLGMLDKGLKAKLTSEAMKIWEKRREIFQDLILSKGLKKAEN